MSLCLSSICCFWFKKGKAVLFTFLVECSEWRLIRSPTIMCCTKVWTIDYYVLQNIPETAVLINTSVARERPAKWGLQRNQSVFLVAFLLWVNYVIVRLFNSDAKAALRFHLLRHTAKVVISFCVCVRPFGRMIFLCFVRVTSNVTAGNLSTFYINRGESSHWVTACYVIFRYWRLRL